jgi:hypothetical protein
MNIEQIPTGDRDKKSPAIHRAETRVTMTVGDLRKQ